MYEANGLNLSRSEYNSLRRLAKCSKENPDGPLTSPGEEEQTLRMLAGKGLVEGQGFFGGYSVDRVTTLGFDFLRDFKSERRKARFRAYFAPVIGGVMGIVGTVAGVILGWWLGSL